MRVQSPHEFGGGHYAQDDKCSGLVSSVRMNLDLKPSLQPPALSDAPLLLLGIVGLAGLTFGWLVAILLGHVLHVPAAHYPEGILSPIVLSNYSKLQEIVLYLLSLAASGLCVAGAVFEWRWYVEKLRAVGTSLATARWTAAATLLGPIAYVVLRIPGGELLTDVAVLPIALAIVIALQVVILQALQRRATGRTAAADTPGDDNEITLPPAPALPQLVGDLSVLARLVMVLFAGYLFGSYLPFVAASPETADLLAGAWFLWPIGAVVGHMLLARRLAEGENAEKAAATNALYPFFPALALLAMPLLWATLLGRAVLFGAVVIATVALAAAVRSRRLPPLPAWCVSVACALFMAGFLATSVLLQNPTLLPGAFVGPFDGENWFSWMSDGTFGRVPFRDFAWPYGPLMYYVELAFVNAFRLDSYRVPFTATELFVAALLSCYIMAFMLRRRATALLAAPVLVAMYGGSVQLRVWLGCVAVVTIVWALERRSRMILMLGGIACVVALLNSPEIGMAAIVTSLATIVGYGFAVREEPWRRGDVLHNLGWFGVGAAIVVVPAAVLGAATHVLVPYVVMTTQFISIAEACCATPFPPMFVGSLLAVPAGSDPLWLLRDETFRIFYGPPVVMTISIGFVAVRALVKRSISREDAALGAMTLFSAIIFRIALGRSEPGHSAFAMLPTMIVAICLAERALFAAVRSLRELRAALAGRRATSAFLTSVQVAALGGFGVLLVGVIFHAQTTFNQWFLPVSKHVRTYYSIERALPKEIPVPAGSRLIQSADGERFFFREGTVDDIPPTLAFLRSSLGPRDTVCGIPFLSRYQFLIHRPSAVPLGCNIWGLGEMPVWRQRLLEELEATKPRYLVFNDADWPDPDGIPWMDREPELAAYYFDHYHIAKRFGKTTIYELGAPPAPPSMLDTSAPNAAPDLRTGWYEQEINPLGAFRWTAKTATARLRQLPDQRTFEFDAQIITPQVPGAPPQTLTVDLNGRAILTTPVANPQLSVQRFRVPIPPVQRPTTVTVGFRFDNKFAAITDPRVLGMAIERFGFVRGTTHAFARAPLATPTPAPTPAAVAAAAAAAADAHATLAPAAQGVPAANVPPGLDRYPDQLQGLIPAAAPGCCWISLRNRFAVEIPPNAHRMVLTFAVPGNAFAAGEEGITATFGGSAPQAHHGLPVGPQTVSFDIPSSVHPGRNVVDLVLDKTFVPAEKHINADMTHYGVILQRVDFP